MFLLVATMMYQQVPGPPMVNDGPPLSVGMEEIADVRFGRGLVGAVPAAVDPAALEQERQIAVAELLAHRRPRLGRGQDLGRDELVGDTPSG